MSGTVLVTGAGGFVGSAVVRRLVSGDASFHDGPVERIVALLSSGGSSWRLEDVAGSAALQIVRADLSNRPALRSVLDAVRPRAVLHAALPSAAYETVFEGEDDPVIAGPINTLMNALSRMPGSRFIHAGSAWVLRSGTGLRENAPLEPLTAYARNKARADVLIPRVADRERVAWLNLRLFNIFGRFEPATRLVPTIVARLTAGEIASVTHGAQLRDFNDVDDMADAFAKALSAPESASNALYHIGSGRATAVRDFVLMIARFLERPDLVRFGAATTRDDDVAALTADPSLARARLGWQPNDDLEGRARSAVAWWLQRLNAEIGR